MYCTTDCITDLDADLLADCADTCIDGDGDTYGDAGGSGNTCTDVDCEDADDQIWAIPAEAVNLRFSSESVLEWDAPIGSGGTPASALYDTIRSDVVTMGGPGAHCVETDDGPNTTSTDTDDPGGGVVFYYLVRAVNSCGEGPLGYGRTAPSCPLP
jgi:hypothetical protein